MKFSSALVAVFALSLELVYGNPVKSGEPAATSSSHHGKNPAITSKPAGQLHRPASSAAGGHMQSSRPSYLDSLDWSKIEHSLTKHIHAGVDAAFQPYHDRIQKQRDEIKHQHNQLQQIQLQASAQIHAVDQAQAHNMATSKRPIVAVSDLTGPSGAPNLPVIPHSTQGHASSEAKKFGKIIHLEKIHHSTTGNKIGSSQGSSSTKIFQQQRVSQRPLQQLNQQQMLQRLNDGQGLQQLGQQRMNQQLGQQQPLQQLGQQQLLQQVGQQRINQRLGRQHTIQQLGQQQVVQQQGQQHQTTAQELHNTGRWRYFKNPTPIYAHVKSIVHLPPVPKGKDVVSKVHHQDTRQGLQHGSSSDHLKAPVHGALGQRSNLFGKRPREGVSIPSESSSSHQLRDNKIDDVAYTQDLLDNLGKGPVRISSPTRDEIRKTKQRALAMSTVNTELGLAPMAFPPEKDPSPPRLPSTKLGLGYDRSHSRSPSHSDEK